MEFYPLLLVGIDQHLAAAFCLVSEDKGKSIQSDEYYIQTIQVRSPFDKIEASAMHRTGPHPIGNGVLSPRAARQSSAAHLRS